MDSFPRLTTRQRLRRLRYGFPKAVRLCVLAGLALLLGGFLAGLSFNASAIGTVAGTSVATNKYTTAFTKRLGGTFTSAPADKAAACSEFASAKGSDLSYSTASQSFVYTVSVTGSAVNCTYNFTNTTTQLNGCTVSCTSTQNGSSQTGYTLVVVYDTVCPANASADASTCVCNLGFKPSGSPATCTAYTCETRPLGEYNAQGQGVNVGSVPLGFGKPGYICDTAATAQGVPLRPGYGCSSTVELKMVSQVDGETGKTFWMSEVQNGKPCQGGSGVAAAEAASGVSTTAEHPPASATPCAKGTCSGTQNGASVCVACSWDKTGGSSTEQTTKTEGAASAPTSATIIGSVKETVCRGDTCVTTTTSSGTTSGTGAGSTTSVTTSTENKTEFCAQNEGNPQCSGTGGEGGGGPEGSGGFGGTCAAGFQCTGETDAVTCAIAKEQHIRECQFWGTDDTGAAKNAGLAAYVAGDTPGTHPRAPGNITSQAVSFDQTDLLGSGCPADVSVPMPGGGHVMLPLSALCAPAGWLGNLLVGITALACLGIAFKGS